MSKSKEVKKGLLETYEIEEIKRDEKREKREKFFQIWNVMGLKFYGTYIPKKKSRIKVSK